MDGEWSMKDHQRSTQDCTYNVRRIDRRGAS